MNENLIRVQEKLTSARLGTFSLAENAFESAWLTRGSTSARGESTGNIG